jgi:hypothetical protein
MVHSDAHSKEELILNKELFPDIEGRWYIQLLDPERPGLRIILKARHRPWEGV